MKYKEESPEVMEKMEHLGLSRQHVGLVIPSGYVFNTDGSAIYMATTAIFIAQALGIDLTWQQEGEMLAVAMVTSKGAGGVAGAEGEGGADGVGGRGGVGDAGAVGVG